MVWCDVMWCGVLCNGAAPCVTQEWYVSVVLDKTHSVAWIAQVKILLVWTCSWLKQLKVLFACVRATTPCAWCTGPIPCVSASAG